MGGAASSDATSDDVLIMYQQLINLGFNDEISLIAAKKHPNNLEKAVNIILNEQSIKTQHESHSKLSDKSEKMDSIDCKGIQNCASLNRLIEILKYSKQQTKSNDNDIDSYFHENKQVIINDYHHILNHHLNEENNSTLKSNENFDYIYNILISDDNDLKSVMSQNVLCTKEITEIETMMNQRTMNQNLELIYWILFIAISFILLMLESGILRESMTKIKRKKKRLRNILMQKLVI